jgi:hypothetical protein
MKKGVLIFVATLISIGVYAQKGYLRGKILDGESGEGLIGATAYKEGTSTGAVADFDGNYSITLKTRNAQYCISIYFLPDTNHSKRRNKI